MVKSQRLPAIIFSTKRKRVSFGPPFLKCVLERKAGGRESEAVKIYQNEIKSKSGRGRFQWYMLSDTC